MVYIFVRLLPLAVRIIVMFSVGLTVICCRHLNQPQNIMEVTCLTKHRQEALYRYNVSSIYRYNISVTGSPTDPISLGFALKKAGLLCWQMMDGGGRRSEKQEATW